MKSMKNTKIISTRTGNAGQLVFDTKTFTFLHFRVYLCLMHQLS